MLIPNVILIPSNFPEEKSKDSEAGLQFDKDCLSSGGRLDPKAAQAFPWVQVYLQNCFKQKR